MVLELWMSERLISDLGGKPAGEIPREERRQLFWEKQLIAVVNLLSARLDITLDEFRRAVEGMSPEEYARSYLYGRRLDVAFIAFLREELKFDGIDALIRQMDDDSRRARSCLAAAPQAFPKLGVIG